MFYLLSIDRHDLRNSAAASVFNLVDYWSGISRSREMSHLISIEE